MVISDCHLKNLFTHIVKLAYPALCGLIPTMIEVPDLVPKALEDFGVTFESSKEN